MAKLSVECHKFLKPFLFTKILILQLCIRPSSPFHVGKILVYSMPYADYHKIDLKKAIIKINHEIIISKKN